LVRIGVFSGYEGPDSRDKETCSVPDPDPDPKFLGLPDPDQLGEGTYPKRSIIKQGGKKTSGFFYFVTSF
jgi:hypothetical protein